MPTQLQVASDGSERFPYNEAGFPVRALDGSLSVFPGYAAACHWHPEFELLLVREGALCYFVNGETVPVKAGEAIFVNANRLHYGFSPQRGECLYSFLLFGPSLLGEPTVPARLLAGSLAADGEADYALLKPESRADRQPLSLLRQALKRCQAREPYYEADVQADCLRLVAALCRKLRPGADRAAPDPSWEILRRMVGYLQENYREPILLKEIAAAGAVCRSRCCQLFREYLHVTPMAYLTRYRLEKSCELLQRAEGSMSAIAHDCGFSGASYFAEQFRRRYHTSPRAYREARRK